MVDKAAVWCCLDHSALWSEGTDLTLAPMAARLSTDSNDINPDRKRGQGKKTRSECPPMQVHSCFRKTYNCVLVVCVTDVVAVLTVHCLNDE